MNRGRLLFLLSLFIFFVNLFIEGTNHLPKVLFDTVMSAGVLAFIIFSADRQGDDKKSQGDGSDDAILYKPPWGVVSHGTPVGTYRSMPIPAWIMTSDGRKAFYSGITPNPLPEGFTCMELPQRGELIIPPGLVYSVRRV